MDLGATRLQTRAAGRAARRCGRRSSRPALLVFALSFDDFVLSFFTTGESPQPLPVRIWSAIRFGVTPTINAIGTLMLAISIVLRSRSRSRCRGCWGGARAGSACYWGGRRHERGGAVRGRHQAVRRGDGGRRPQPHDRAAASSSRCSGRRAAARRRRCGWWRASSSRPRARSSSRASRWRRVPPYKRNVNTVFQSYALFEHLDIEGNVAFGLKRRKVPRRRSSTRVAEALELVQLTGRETRAAERALRRPAPARRARARARQPARRAAARRAARRARPQAAQADAGGAQGDPARGRDHVPLRHPRPGGGARDVRPHRGHERRRRRAVRHARGGLRAAGASRSWPASSASRT